MKKRIALDITTLRVDSFATGAPIQFDATNLVTCDPCDGLTPDCESVPCGPTDDTHCQETADCTQPGMCLTAGCL